jgi:hypothetical protein
LPALSINSLAMSPVDPNTLFAGTGSTSSFGFNGSPGFGVARSTDGGATWDVLASDTFDGRAITSVVPTSLSGGHVVLAATLRSTLAGVYRSTDNGVSFTRISGNGASGLPDAGVSKLIADPGNANRLYAGVPQAFGGGAQAGVYRSTDGGVTWTAANTGLAGLATSLRILLSVHNDASNNVVYAAIIANDRSLSGVFRSTNQGATWTSLGVPAPPIFPGGQGNIHGALAADPVDPNVVFIAGDRQDGPFPNQNGCNHFSANVFRYTGTIWENIVCGGANGTSPHPDSRDTQFDANGNLLQANDGGIYRLLSPNSAGRRWASVLGNIRPTELHSVAFDPLSKVVIGGAQDNGTPFQSASGDFTATDVTGGDGGPVAVDADQAAHPGTTLRYTTRNSFGCAAPGNPSPQNTPFFMRSTWNAANNFVTSQLVGLNIISGAGTGQNLCQFDPNIQFYNPYVLNAIKPEQMLIGTANIYESTNGGTSLNNLMFTGQFIGGDFSYGQPIAYGGRLDGRDFPEVFYVGAGNHIFHRVSGSIVQLTAYPGFTIRTIVMHPQNYRQVFVADASNRVWGSFDEGASWVELTGNLSSLTDQVATIEVASRGIGLGNQILIAGGFGAFQLRNPAEAEEDWEEIVDEPSREISNALLQDLHYDSTDNVLVAGTLGRGAWTVSRFFRGGESDAVARIATGGQTSASLNTPPVLNLPRDPRPAPAPVASPVAPRAP